MFERHREELRAYAKRKGLRSGAWVVVTQDFEVRPFSFYEEARAFRVKALRSGIPGAVMLTQYTDHPVRLHMTRAVRVGGRRKLAAD